MLILAAAPRLAGLAPPRRYVPSPAYDWKVPQGFPVPCVPADNPMSAEKVALGRRLFFDTRLSGNGTQACASCHRPERAFTDGKAHAVGSTGSPHPRGAMSLVNVAYNASFTWVDAGRPSLEEQAKGPMLNEDPVELGLSGRESEVTTRLAADADYERAFSAAFPEDPLPITFDNVRKAIASFERTLFSGDSPYDRLVWRDDRGALSDSARRGMTLFFSDRLACAKCHAGFTFSGPVSYDSAPPGEPTFHDTGLDGRFRAPTLRNVAVTAPYMHDGRFATLEQVIEHYASPGKPSPGRSPLVRGFSITQQGRTDLVEFLKSLTDDSFLADSPKEKS
ncbi:MAG: cytochrome c peroxidase [Thermoanaerobaculia bacterium]